MRGIQTFVYRNPADQADQAQYKQATSDINIRFGQKRGQSRQNGKPVYAWPRAVLIGASGVWPDVPALFVVAIVLAVLMPRAARA
jgi:hypothetical protein